MYSSIENPEEALEKRLKEDKEMEKARVMREAKSRRVREGGHSRKMTKSYLEEGYEKGSDNDSVVGEDEVSKFTTPRSMVDGMLECVCSGILVGPLGAPREKGRKGKGGWGNSSHRSVLSRARRFCNVVLC